MNRFSHTGLCVGPVTPMKTNGDINLDVLSAYSDHLASSGVNALFVNGTTGEGLSMTIAERLILAEKWMQVARSKFPTIIIHCGALCLRDAQQLAAHAETIGADAIAALPSFYFRPKDFGEILAAIRSFFDFRGLTEGMAEIASAAPKTPFIYYHNPKRSHVDMDMASFIEHAKTRIPTLVGIKWAGPDLSGALKCKMMHGDSLLVMWANDDVLLSALSAGIESFNGSSYSFTAPIADRIIRAFKKGQMAEAEKEQVFLKKLIALTEEGDKKIPRHKEILTKIVGIPVGPTRRPIVPLSEEETKQFGVDLENLKFTAAIGQ